MKFLTSFVNTFLFGFLSSQIYYIILVELFHEPVHYLLLLSVIQLVLSGLILGINYVCIFLPLYITHKHQFEIKSKKEIYFNLMPLAILPSFILIFIIASSVGWNQLEPELLIEFINLILTIFTSFWVYVRSMSNYKTESSQLLNQSIINNYEYEKHD